MGYGIEKRKMEDDVDFLVSACGLVKFSILLDSCCFVDDVDQTVLDIYVMKSRLYTSLKDRIFAEMICVLTYLNLAPSSFSFSLLPEIL